MTVVLLLAGLAVPEAARAESPAVPDKPPLVAARRSGPIAIDGAVNEPAWRAARPASGFVTRYPEQGRPARPDTEVRLLYDERALFISARCHDPEPDKIVARVTRRDGWVESDSFAAYIDSRHDRRTCFWFRVNAAGVQMDGTCFDENQQTPDWDGVWQSAARIDERGWTVELRIPLRLLRFDPGENVTFGINFARWDSRRRQESWWQHLPRESGHLVSEFGTVTGLAIPSRPFDLRLIPYLALRPHLAGADDAGAAAPRFFDPGLDGRAALGRDFNVTFTINPDFGQVEVDQMVLNLSTIETFFPEKRPFFLEDMETFRTPQLSGGPWGAQLFYSRRIGRTPRDPDLADDEKLLQSARLPRIWGAAKMAGRTAGRFRLGFMQAFTSREDALVLDGAGREARRLAEPFTSHSVLRLQQDFLDHSSAGFMATALATPDQGTALTGAGDLQLELFGGDYKLGALAYLSYLSEGRYAWQDQYLERALEQDGPVGWGGQLRFEKTSGKYLVGSLDAIYYSTNLALNDLGYLDRANRLAVSGRLEHRRLEPLGPLNSYEVNLGAWIERSAEWRNLGDGFSLDLEADFRSGWGVGMWMFSGFPLCDDRETRSAGRVAFCGSRHRWRGGLWFWSDSRLPVHGWGELQFMTTERDFGLRAALTAAVELHPQLRLELVPGYFRSTGSLRWIDTETLADGAERFLFADQHAESWDVTLRSTLVFTTELTLQVFAQLFMLSVDNRDKFAGPVPAGSSFGVGDLVAAPDLADDYDYRSLGLNLSVVLRYEYLPGSVAYLVYTGSFSNSADIAEFRPGPFLGDLRSAEADHVLLIKLSYFWG